MAPTVPMTVASWATSSRKASQRARSASSGRITCADGRPAMFHPFEAAVAVTVCAAQEPFSDA